jgi:hypothetical protein
MRWQPAAHHDATDRFEEPRGDGSGVFILSYKLEGDAFVVDPTAKPEWPVRRSFALKLVRVE